MNELKQWLRAPPREVLTVMRLRWYCREEKRGRW